MANECTNNQPPNLTMAVPKRLPLEVVHNGTLYTETFTGNINDTNNFDTETIDEWVDGGAYTVGDWVKIDALKMKYLCGIDGTNAYPPDLGADWYGVPLSAWSYRDNTPTRQSIKEYIEDENIEIEMNLLMQDNFLFIQNMDAISSLKVEAIKEDGTVFKVLAEVDLFKWINFSCCVPCGSTWDLRQNFSMFFNSCGFYTKLKITLYVVEDKIAKVGTCAVSTSHKVGRLTDYVSPSIKSSNKLKENMVDKKLEPTKGVKYGNYDVKVDSIDIVSPNLLNKTLIQNLGEICYFSLDFDGEDLSEFTGFYTDFTSQVGGVWEKPLSIKINVTPSQKGI